MPQSRLKHRNKNPQTRTRRPSSALGRGGSSLVTSAGSSVRSNVIERTLPLFPVKTIRKLRYSTNFSLASTAGVVVTQVFGANCLFDPDITGTGHQPMGFDEMMLYYNHYTVTNCELKLICKAVSSSKMTVMVRMDSSSTPITVIDRLVELGGFVSDVISNTGVYGDAKEMHLGLDIAKIQGVSRSAMTADTSLRGTSGANPSEITYFHVAVFDAAALTGTVNFSAVMDFVAVFTEARDATESIQERAKQLLLKQAQLGLATLFDTGDEKHPTR